MSQTPGSFRPSELDDADVRGDDAATARAWAAARELEAAVPPESVTPSAGFADRVMAAVAREPAPRPAGFLVPLRRRPGIAGLVASLRDAWVVVGAGAGRPLLSRGAALAYVLAVILVGTSLTGAAGYGAASALGWLDGPSPTPSLEPSPAPTSVPTPSPAPTNSAEPTASPESTETIEPGESDAPTGSHEPSESPEDNHTPPAQSTPGTSPGPSEDGTASPSPEDDGGSGGSGSTPRPSSTPKPSETPH